MLFSDQNQRFVSSRYLSRNCLFLAILLTSPLAVWGDTWAAPRNKDYSSSNGAYRFSVEVAPRRRNVSNRCQGVLKQRVHGEWQTVWEKPLSSKVSPVNAIVHDKGRFVVTFDEWYGIGNNPVIIYNKQGDMVAKLQLNDLGIPHDHPLIQGSVSSYYWNSYAIYLFGPLTKDDQAAWHNKLAETLFIRLHWGEVLAIDLSTGTLISKQDTRGLSKADAMKLKNATEKFITQSYRELAKTWLVERNFFEPDPKSDGIRGLLLAKELKLKEYLPIIKKVAETDRFQSWAAPRWAGAGREKNLQRFAQHVLKSVESQ